MEKVDEKQVYQMMTSILANPSVSIRIRDSQLEVILSSGPNSVSVYTLKEFQKFVESNLK